MMFKRLYEWTLRLAEKPRATWALGTISFAESSFFPIPPDVILVPMSLARPDKAWFYAGLCTVTSVLGGLVGYAIGALLYDSLGAWIINAYGYGDKVDEFRAMYAQWGAWIILLKGLTPIPYKLVTITSGFAGYDLLWFTVLSIITRGARFYLLAGLLSRFGEPIKRLMDEHFALMMIAILAAIVGGFYLVKYVV
jgi:membrane protein YqaA with SNARE-associated domain